MMFNAGADWSQFAESEEGLALYQTELARIQIEHEEHFMELALRITKPSVIICDRGVFDGKAFCPPAVWAHVLANLGTTEPALLKRYNAVIHMVTAADGAEAFYNMDNPARREDPAQAQEVDRRLRQCWEDHPGLHIVENDGRPFVQKIQEVVSIIYGLVGVDAQGCMPRRFVVKVSNLHELRQLFPRFMSGTEFHLMDIYLGPRIMLRKRRGTTMNYFRLEREPVQVQAQAQAVLVERTHRLRQEEFDAHLQAGKQQEVRILHKWVMHFEWQKHSWELHFFRETATCILAVETDAEGPLQILPSFLEARLSSELPKTTSGEFEDYELAALILSPGGHRLEVLAEDFEATTRTLPGRPLSPSHGHRGLG